MSDKPAGTINVSLKAAVNSDPWITVTGTVEEVLRSLWTISPACRKYAEAQDLFGAVYAANAEYAGFKARAQVVTTAPAPAPVAPNDAAMPAATELVKNELGGTVVDFWANAPDAPPTPTTSAWGSAPSEPAPAGSGPNGAAPQCPHGTKKLIEGIAKTGPNVGKPWKAWGCPADRNHPGRCPLDYIN